MRNILQGSSTHFAVRNFLLASFSKVQIRTIFNTNDEMSPINLILASALSIQDENENSPYIIL